MYSYHYHEAKNYFIVRFNRQPLVGEFIEFIEELYEFDWYKPTINEIWDFTLCDDLTFEITELMEITKLSQEIQIQEVGVKAALVGKSPATIQVLEDFAILSKELAHQHRVFRHMGSAIKWVES